MKGGSTQTTISFDIAHQDISAAINGQDKIYFSADIMLTINTADERYTTDISSTVLFGLKMSAPESDEPNLSKLFVSSINNYDSDATQITLLDLVEQTVAQMGSYLLQTFNAMSPLM
jgi:hypothetical protein